MLVFTQGIELKDIYFVPEYKEYSGHFFNPEWVFSILLYIFIYVYIIVHEYVNIRTYELTRMQNVRKTGNWPALMQHQCVVRRHRESARSEDVFDSRTMMNLHHQPP